MASANLAVVRGLSALKTVLNEPQGLVRLADDDRVSLSWGGRPFELCGTALTIAVDCRRTGRDGRLGVL